MSSRVVFEHWQMIFPAVGFALFFGVFAWVVVRALRMKRPALDHALNLPLQDESRRASSHD